MKNILLVLVGILMITVIAVARNIPEAIHKAFNTSYPKATNVSWSKESQNEYEADFTQDGKKMSANYRLDGALVESETLLHVTELPKGVMEYMNKIKPDCTPKEIARVEYPDGKTNFEVELKRHNYFFDAAGNFLRMEKD